MGDTKTSGPEGPSETSAMLEGAEIHQGQSGGSSHSNGVQALPFESKGALPLANFDMLAAMGEAEQFVLSLKAFIDTTPLSLDPRWNAISKSLDYAVGVHDRLNSTNSTRSS